MYYIGLDLGQRQDHSALVIVERCERTRAFLPPEFEAVLVRHIERVPLGTPYPQVVRRVCQIVSHPELAGRCTLIVDGTGVGSPVVEMLRAAHPGCAITAVLITGGERTHAFYASGGPSWTVPKQDLLAGVQVLLERGELRIAAGMPETTSLLRELLDVRSTPGKRGKPRLGADGYGEHDDLVIALSLAVWGTRTQKQAGFSTRRLPGI